MVAERGFSPLQQCTSERIAKHAADVLILLLREEIVDIVRTISHERIKQRIVEKIADVPVLSIQTQLSNIVDVLDAIRKNLEQMQNDMFRVKTNHEDLVMKYIDDKVTDVPVVLQKEDLEADTAKHSSVLETAVSRSTLDGEVSSRDRILQHTMEQTLDVPMPEMVTQSVEVPKTISQNRIQQRTMKQIVDDPVVQIVQIPQVHVVEKTAEIPVMTQRHISRDGVQQRTVEQIVDAPVPQTVKELTEVSKVFSQDRIQQRVVEQTIEDPAIPLVEKTVEMPVIRTKEKTQHVVYTHVQHVVNTVEVERPKLIKETQHRKKPIINEKINQMTKHIKIP